MFFSKNKSKNAAGTTKKADEAKKSEATKESKFKFDNDSLRDVLIFFFNFLLSRK